MWFLLLQIFLFLLAAALAGAVFGHWWARRRFVDVTESHQSLEAQVRRMDILDRMPTRADLEQNVATVRTAIAGVQMPDFKPVEDRLARVEEAVADRAMRSDQAAQERASRLEQQAEDRASRTDQAVQAKLTASEQAVQARLAAGEQAMQDRLMRIEQTVAAIRIPEPNLAPINERIGTLEAALRSVLQSVARLANTDLAPVDARLTNIENAVRAWKAPDVDLGPVHAGIVSLQLALDQIKGQGSVADVLQGQLASLETAVSHVNERVAAIHLPEPNLEPINAALAEIDRSLSSIDKSPVNLDPLHERVANLHAAVGTVQSDARRSLEPIERRIAGLQEAVGSMPQPDISGLIEAVHAIDSRQDLAAVEDRITAIEYSLAALHHMLRARDGAPRENGRARPAVPAPVVAPKPPAPVVAAPVRPSRESDPINSVRKAYDEANLLNEAAFGPADDLEAIQGVGPILASVLQEIGVYYFWQVAEWTPEEAAWVDSQLMHFRGRIKRDDWVGHAKVLAARPGAARRPAAPPSTGNVWRG